MIGSLTIDSRTMMPGLAFLGDGSDLVQVFNGRMQEKDYWLGLQWAILGRVIPSLVIVKSVENLDQVQTRLEPLQ